jgi:hypothetical protein
MAEVEKRKSEISAGGAMGQSVATGMIGEVAAAAWEVV